MRRYRTLAVLAALVSLMGAAVITADPTVASAVRAKPCNRHCPTPTPTTATPTPTPTTTPPPGGQYTPAYFGRWANGPTADPGYFPIGVWIQDPNRQRNGRNNALNYRDAGVNTFVGQWDFPTRADSESRLATIKEAGMTAWAGDDTTIAQANALPSAAALTAHHLGDEQDMKPGDCADCTSTTIRDKAAAMHTQDPSRPVYNNFGKGFALYPWIGYHVDAGPTREDDLRRYCSNIDIPSSDYYAATDGWESAEKHTPAFYGAAIRNTRLMCGDGTKPVLGFVETGHPFDEGQCASHPPYSVDCTITPDGLEWAVWSELANGANGIIYFAHDFHTGSAVEDGVFDHPETLARMTAVDQQITALTPILNTARVPGGVTAAGADATLRGPYVVAAENAGAAGTVTFGVASAAGRPITVMGEGRTLAADATGSWTDTFTGWGHHVYQIG